MTEAEPAPDQGVSQSAVDSAPPVSAGPLARDVYDWAARLTAEASGRAADYYWTPQSERLVGKLNLSKQALIGVLGVQGAGKSAAMRAIQKRLATEEAFGRDHIVAVKVPESGGLQGALKDAVGDALVKQLDGLLNAEVLDRIQRDSAFYQRAIQLAKRMERSVLEERLHLLDPESGISVDTTNFYLPPSLHPLISKLRIRELEEHALDRLLSERRVIMIDMPDYPKHDRRLIARDLDEVQGLWNRLAASDKDTTLVIFLQKETFNYADHFFYGKMDIIPLMPLTVNQLLEAYKQKWAGYEPFTQDALEDIGRMSRGVFRRFKRYIGLTLELWMTQGAQSTALIDLELVNKAVTDEDVVYDIDKDLEGIFRRPEQKQKALELINHLSQSTTKAYGENLNDTSQIVEHAMKQAKVSKLLDISEMAVSRLLRELEQHGYIKRLTRPLQTGGGEEKIVQLNL